MSSPVDLPAVTGYAAAETTPAWVRIPVFYTPGGKAEEGTNRFMSDKIMPLSEAVEGYDLFDKMKVQKGEMKSSRQQSFDTRLPNRSLQSYSRRKSR